MSRHRSAGASRRRWLRKMASQTDARSAEKERRGGLRPRVTTGRLSFAGEQRDDPLQPALVDPRRRRRGGCCRRRARPISSPRASSTGTTISDAEAESQAMWPGKASTSATRWSRRAPRRRRPRRARTSISRHPIVPGTAPPAAATARRAGRSRSRSSTGSALWSRQTTSPCRQQVALRRDRRLDLRRDLAVARLLGGGVHPQLARLLHHQRRFGHRPPSIQESRSLFHERYTRRTAAAPLPSAQRAQTLHS